MNSAITHFLRGVWIAWLVVLAALPASGWAQSPPPVEPGEGGSPVNAICPVTTDEPIDTRFVVGYNGRVIAFCCRECRTKFEQDPGAYLQNLPVSFERVRTTPEEHEQADEHSDHSHDAGGESSTDAAAHPQQDGEGDEHAHSHDSGERSRLAAWVGKFHPPATHLPIGLLIGAAIAELGMVTSRNTWFRHAAGFCLALGTVGAIIAATLGWFNGGFVLLDDDWVQATHRWLGTSTAGLSLLSLVLFARAARPGASSGAVVAYRVVLLVTASLVSATGFFGGALVYGINHYAW